MQPQLCHPGLLLRNSFLKPLGLTAYRLSKAIGVPQTRLSQILQGKRSITADTSLRLGRFFGVEPDFFASAQLAWDLSVAEAKIHSELARIRPFEPQALA